MEQFAMMLSLLGLLFLAIGSIGLVIDAFREGFFWGLGCLLFAPVALAFIVFHWQEAKQAFCIWLIGFVMIFLAGSISSEPKLVEEPVREQELQEVEDERKPSSFKSIGIGIGVFVLLGGICVVLVKSLMDRLSSDTYEDEEDQSVDETAEDPFAEEITNVPTIQSLIADLENGDPMVREYAAQELGGIGDKQAIQLLAKVLRDENQAVRKAARKSLIQVLAKTLDDEDPRVRANAARALGKIGDKRGIKPLAMALKDKEQAVRTAAKEGLSIIKSKLGPLEWGKT